nr:hypothetical protein [Micromonospora sp. DSM 115978]
RRVQANDAGENGFAIQIGLWSTIVLVSPTAATASVLLADAGNGRAGLVVATLAVAVANGAAVGWGLGALACGWLDEQLPETFARLRYPGFKANGKTGSKTGNGRQRRRVLDFLTARADASAAAARKAKQGSGPARNEVPARNEASPPTT